MLPAGHGDSLLLTYGDTRDYSPILIDGGPYYCYSELRTRIQQIKEALQLLVITHVDADHVEGIVNLLQDASVTIPIQGVWFNGWRQIEKSAGMLSPVAGEYLSALIARRALPWNQIFQGAAVASGPGSYPVAKLDGGLTMTVLSPPVSALRQLSGIWDRTVREAGLVPGSEQDAERHMVNKSRFHRHEMLGGIDLDKLSRESGETDKSIVNGSSIAILAEFANKSALLAGDAHPTVLEKAIRSLLTLRRQPKLRLDAFKVAHHGSKGSVTNSLLQLIDCRDYLFSTNSAYFGHPDDEAVARIVRHGGPGVTLRFNYPQTGKRFWDDPAVQQREGYEVVYPVGGNGLTYDVLAAVPNRI
jgi:beta-lactamase superfamily II metal-dependent hydrolase